MPAKSCLERLMYRVSIVMPTYNRGYCLADTIQSVLDQTYKRWELLVVDNMSKDDTKEIVEGFGDARIRFMQIQNSGVIAVSRNCGIAAASGEFVAFMDSDDPWLPGTLLQSNLFHNSGETLVLANITSLALLISLVYRTIPKASHITYL